MTGLLAGVRVLDLSRVLAGPFCSMQLADMGADVIKIEQPGSGDGTREWGPPWAGSGSERQSAYFLAINRNKRSLTLNLKSERGKDILKLLAARSDVLIENFKVDTLAGMGLGYDDLRAENPSLIYCSITGYGQTGPYRDRPGYDFVIQAQGGIMSISGPVEGPPSKVGVAVVDIAAGLFAATAILSALFHRERTGEGEYIDIALLDTQIAWLANVASNTLISGLPPARYGNAHPNIVPYDIFETLDGYLALGVGTDGQFRRLCQVIGQPHLGEDRRFYTNERRVENRAALTTLFQDAFRTRSTDEWMTRLIDEDIPAGPVNTVDQILSDPHVQAREMVVETHHPLLGALPLVGSPLKLSSHPVKMLRPPPVLGQHTAEVLSETLGYSVDKLEQLRSEGVV